MLPFEYMRAHDVTSAVAAVASDPGAQFLAGGTSQVDLMKEGVQRPTRLVDIGHLPLGEIRRTPSGGVRIGANASNAVAADHPLILAGYLAIAEALHAGASQQIRNVASFAGNPLQRTRCPYLRDLAQPCNKRQPGTGCAAVAGFNRLHAIFGQTDEGATGGHTCIAVHPSDLAVALAVHDAVVMTEGPAGGREIPFGDLLRLPGDQPDLDFTLRHGELITAVELPASAGRSHYLKVRDRASYAYGLVTCAVAVEMDGDRIAAARIALGGVAAKPWRVPDAEAMLAGAAPGEDLFGEVAEHALRGARTYAMNAYKPALGRALVVRGLMQVTGLEPLPGEAGTVFAASVGNIATAPVVA